MGRLLSWYVEYYAISYFIRPLIGSFLGFTPLHMAFMRRHWETAKLVLAIAAAQYNPDEPESQPFQTKNITLGGIGYYFLGIYSSMHPQMTVQIANKMTMKTTRWRR